MANYAPRAGITYEQVAAAADAILGQGITPTINGIREALGSGSPNTIHKHLTAWREALPRQSAESPILPSALVAAFSAEIARATAEARAEVENKLVQALKESADLAAAGEALETERDHLLALLDDLTTTNNIFSGRCGEQSNEITRLTADLERERAAGDQKTTELAQVRNRVQSLTETLAEKSDIIEKLTDDSNTEKQGRIEAEKRAAVLEAQLAASQEQTREAKTREIRAVQEVGEKVAAIEKLTLANELEKGGRIEAEKISAVLQSQLASAQDRINEARAREDKIAEKVDPKVAGPSVSKAGKGSVGSTKG